MKRTSLTLRPFAYLAVTAAITFSAQTNLKSQILYETNFDSMTAGANLAGQDGWYNYAGDASAATVVDNAAIAYSDDNFVEFDATNRARSRIDFPLSPAPVVNDTTHNRIQFVFQAAAFGSGGGAKDLAFYSAAGGGGIGMARFSIDGRGDRVLAAVGGTTFSTSFMLGSALTANRWYAVDAYLRPSEYVYDLKLVDTVSSSVVFSQNDIGFGTGSPTLSETFRTIFFDTGTATGVTWRVDNVSISSIPEPGSVALLGLGGLAVFIRRRFKKG
ncbi:MAG: PEP-CTERM sorting domain-containing protein [Chthoniobacterales bacterium]